MIQIGKAIDNVSLEIDLHIIEHFSKHLYSSPTKAIEELVANGYDAAATEVRVYLPGEITENVIIWDNGFSMDVDGLKNLWKIADSPKNDESSRNVKTPAGMRKVIGKFGIGKIASYTIGSQIHHICKSGEHFYSVGIDYDVLLASKKPGDKNAHEESPIYELTEDEAKNLLTESFRNLPADFENFFLKDSWTFALIEKIKDVKLLDGRIKWVLGNGMPIQPQFSISVNSEPIVSNIVKSGVVCNWSFAQSEIQEQITKNWDEEVKGGNVSGGVTFGIMEGLNPDNPKEKIGYAQFPNLGKVWGFNTLYNRSLLGSRESDHGRSYGFFIMVRGRLINQEDAQFFLKDPSFATFYSAQWVLNVDELDSDLLADRERIQESSTKSLELKVLQKAVYRALVAKQQKDFRESQKEKSVENRLPVQSAEYFLEPLAALWKKTGSGEQLGFDFREPKIDAKPLGADRQLSSFSTKEGFTVNSQHPYYQYVSYLLGGSKNGKKVVKELEVVAVSELLFEGFLYDIGINDVDVNKIKNWRDKMLREIARTDPYNLSELSQTLRDTSYQSGAVFEMAIANILNSMGFIATIDGKSGQKDIFVKANCGDESYKFTFEAKGGSSEKGIPNDSAEVSGADAHRVAVGASHAVIVARKFQGFGKGDINPAILKECKASGKVSIMEVEALIHIAESVRKHSYSLESLKEIFTIIESPDEKRERIQKIQEPLDDFNYIEFLQNIWSDQLEIGDGEAVSLRTIWQKYYRKDGFTEDDINIKAQAIRTLVYPFVQYNEPNIYLVQSPENIIQRIQSKFSQPE